MTPGSREVNSQTQSQNNPHIKGRMVALVASVFISLASGTPYLYGVYAPQLIQRIGLTTSDSAVIALASNLGSGVGGLPSGVFIDRYGPQLSVLMGSCFIMLGYFGLFKIYEHAVSNLLLISITMVFIGFGCITSYFATLKAAQANFPNHRGAAGAAPVSAYGLSAIVFSIIASLFFKNNTGGLLNFLSLFCGLVAFIGSWFVHVYLGHEGEEEETNKQNPSDLELGSTDAPQKSSRTSEEAALLSHKSSLNSFISTISANDESAVESSSQSPSEIYKQNTDRTLRGSFSFWGLGYRTPRSSVSSISSDLQPSVQSLRESNSQAQGSTSNQANKQLFSRDGPSTLNRTPTSSSGLNVSSALKNKPLNNNPRKKSNNPLVIIANLLTNKLFWANYMLMGSIAGVSQMYIFCIGFVATAQYNYHKNQRDIPSNNSMITQEDSAASLQALQVSIISITSFAGRLSGGFVSDHLYKKYHIQRLNLIAVTIISLTIGQVSMILNENNIHLLNLSSVIIGMSFGFIFGTYPAIIADYFGTKTFSTTWGLICTSALVFLYILNKIFGNIYDRNTNVETGICYKANGCYKGAFEISGMVCIASLIICLSIIYSQSKKIKTSPSA